MYIYLIECKDTTLYTGITNNLMRRFKEHLSGRGANYTKKHGVLKLRYFEKATSRSEAWKKEREIKKWDRASKWALITGTLISPTYYNKKPQN